MRTNLIVVILLFPLVGVGQNFDWGFNVGGVYNDVGVGITTDDVGNIYTIGYFREIADFDPSTNTANLSSVSAGKLFIAKYSADGNYLWANGIGSLNATSIQVDHVGDIYITGHFYQTIDFDPGPNVANLTPNSSGTMYLAKYDSQGNYIWAFMVESTYSYGGGFGWALSIDFENNIYVTGSFSGEVDFDPGTGNSLIAANNNNIFIAKYDSNGNYIWAIDMGYHFSSDRGESITTDNSGNVYITGTFGNEADFDPGADTAILTANGSYDMFMAKYDGNGNYLWAHNIGGIYGDGGKSIKSDTLGNIYVTGHFSDTVDFDPGIDTAYLMGTGADDIFVAKYNSDGNHVWSFNIEDSGSLQDHAYFVKSIEIDDNEGVYITGTFKWTMDFDPSPDTAALTSFNSNHDIFIAKYNSNGSYIWAYNIQGHFKGYDFDSGNSVSCDNDGNVYLIGNFSGESDFDFSDQIVNLESNGASDVFILRYSKELLSVEANTVSKVFSLYPNPTSKSLFIDLGVTSKRVTVEIINIQGEVLKINEYHLEKLVSIDLTEFTNGIYMTRIRTDDTEEVFKVIVSE